MNRENPFKQAFAGFKGRNFLQLENMTETLRKAYLKKTLQKT